MTKICGIELKASNAMIAIVTSEGEEVELLEAKSKKITLEDDESADSIRAFVAAIEELIAMYEIDVVAIKKRHKKGNFAGGPVSFKMEALIQLSCSEVLLLAPTAVSAAQRKHKFELPDSLKKYQHQAYLTACAAHALALK